MTTPPFVQRSRNGAPALSAVIPLDPGEDLAGEDDNDAATLFCALVRLARHYGALIDDSVAGVLTSLGENLEHPEEPRPAGPAGRRVGSREAHARAILAAVPFDPAEVGPAGDPTCERCGDRLQRLGALGWASTSTGGTSCAKAGGSPHSPVEDPDAMEDAHTMTCELDVPHGSADCRAVHAAAGVLAVFDAVSHGGTEIPSADGALSALWLEARARFLSVVGYRPGDRAFMPSDSRPGESHALTVVEVEPGGEMVRVRFDTFGTETNVEASALVPIVAELLVAAGEVVDGAAGRLAPVGDGTPA